jgi:NAD(P)-dependent dehydrogenase (short-subunit alcohol dehydrogenase family)
MRLQGKVAVVTGGGNGIGKAIALAFAKQGAAVAVVDKNREDGAETAEDIKRDGRQAVALHGDVSIAEDVKRCIDEVHSRYGRLDILVNNAGITGRFIGDGPVADCSEEAWNTIMDVNLKGTFLCCKYGLKKMAGQRSGVIINMSSVLGLAGCQDYFLSHAYQTSKAGIIGLTRSIAVYYAKHGIRANVLAPGLIDSRATAKIKHDEEIMAFARAMQPLGALGAPQDVANAAVYLASDEAAFVTGQVLAVDGGWSAQ